MAARKLEPQIEIPPIILPVIREYIGVTRFSRLSVAEKAELVRIANNTAQELDALLNSET